MPVKHFVIIQEGRVFRVCSIGAGEEPRYVQVERTWDEQPEDVAKKLAEAFREMEYAGQEIVLSIGSRDCLCGRIEIDDLPRKNDPQVLLYRLEEQLPIAAEEVVADFLCDPEEALGVCMERGWVIPLVEALESKGIAIRFIVPTALLALQSRSDLNDASVVLWGNGDLVDAFLLKEGNPCVWQLLPMAAEDIVTRLRMLLLDTGRPMTVRAFGLEQTILEDLSGLPDIETMRNEELPLLTAAGQGASSLLSGKIDPWVNLRRDVLAVKDPYRHVRTPLTSAMLAACFFLITLATVMLWRASRYEQKTSELRTKQEKIYRETMPTKPGMPVPVGIRSRFESEYRKRLALSGQASDIPDRSSALAFLYRVMGSLPTNLRYRILELRLDQGKLYLEGQTRTHSEANTIATALREGTGLEVSVPRTQQLAERGVSFSITALEKADEPEKTGKVGD